MGTNTNAAGEPATTHDALHAAANMATGENNNLDKVRSILFGAQVRETDKRFSRLEQSMAQDMSTLRDAMQRRMDDLEAFMRDEFAALNKRLLSEQRSREDAVEDLTSELKAQVKVARQARSSMEEQFAEAERGVRERLLKQARDLSGAMDQRFDALTAAMRDGQDQLRDDKTDRTALADLFEEVASRLRGEFELPLDQ